MINHKYMQYFFKKVYNTEMPTLWKKIIKNSQIYLLSQSPFAHASVNTVTHSYVLLNKP